VNRWRYSKEVAVALAQRKPVVALESTIIAHGFSYPASLELAHELESTVRNSGATPATIAIVDGQVCIGLTSEELSRLASDGSSFKKAGAADLAIHLRAGNCAATTVSATSLLACKAGISVFATGGIGGVHRGDSDDVSHDLVALSRNKIAVVSAGAKAVLDLETLGVLVVGYRCQQFPAFYTADSGLVLEHHVDSVAELAATLHTHWSELDGGGALICNPIPTVAALPAALIREAIEHALNEAETRRISGKALTPFLLAKLAETTAGKSVQANRALAINNAVVGSELAIALASQSSATDS
jgi:pseudouridylate synthase